MTTTTRKGLGVGALFYRWPKWEPPVDAPLLLTYTPPHLRSPAQAERHPSVSQVMEQIVAWCGKVEGWLEDCFSCGRAFDQDVPETDLGPLGRKMRWVLRQRGGFGD